MTLSAGAAVRSQGWEDAVTWLTALWATMSMLEASPASLSSWVHARDALCHSSLPPAPHTLSVSSSCMKHLIRAPDPREAHISQMPGGA